MIQHIVLFKFKSDTKEKEIALLAQKLLVLKNKFPGIVKCVWGPSISIENLEKGYTHGFIMTFKSKSSRDNYVPHPIHLELIKKYVDPICDDGLVFDINE